MDANDIEYLKPLLMQMAVITQQLDHRNTLAVQQVESSAAALDQGLRELHGGTEHFVRSASQAIGEQTRRAVAQAVGDTMLVFDQQLRASAHMAQQAARAMEKQSRRLAAARRTLVWHGAIGLLIGSLLATSAAGFVGWQTAQEVGNAQFAQDILRATQSGALNRCGKNLCVKIGKQAHRYAKDAAYVLIPD